MSEFADQSQVDERLAVGEAILALLAPVVDGYVPALAPKLDRDRAFGRELLMCVFVAARGDGSVNRISVVAGVAQAIGEAVAQQPTESGVRIVASMQAGLEDGLNWARATFGTAGEA